LSAFQVLSWLQTTNQHAAVVDGFPFGKFMQYVPKWAFSNNAHGHRVACPPGLLWRALDEFGKLAQKNSFDLLF
jgi:hypothetical protein